MWPALTNFLPWTVEHLTAQLRQLQYAAHLSDEEMCELIENFLQRQLGVENENADATDKGGQP